MDFNILFWIVPAAAVLALLFAWFFFVQMKRESEGTERMTYIAAAVRKGAMAYLKQQYRVVAVVFVVLAAIFAIMAYVFHIQNEWVPFAFLTGGLFSGVSGYLGMKTATYASARTANAARDSMNKGLRMAFRSGAVMGLIVVGLGLLDISVWYLVLDAFVPEDADNAGMKLCFITTTMLTFGMGASTQALFARVGGGIYTKAADVGADLYESYCGSILSTAALGAAAFAAEGGAAQVKAVFAPMIIAAVFIIVPSPVILSPLMFNTILQENNIPLNDVICNPE